MFKILGAKNRRKNLHKHPGPPFQIRGGPGSFSNAKTWDIDFIIVCQNLILRSVFVNLKTIYYCFVFTLRCQTSRVDILHKFLKQVGPNKQVGWRKKAVNLKGVVLLSVKFQKIVPHKTS